MKPSMKHVRMTHDNQYFVHFEGLGDYTFKVLHYLNPLKDDYFLSGAIPSAYKAPNRLSCSYWIVKPEKRVISQQVYLTV